MEDIYDKEETTFKNFVLMPVKLLGLFLICYLDNPFMKTLGKYLIVSLSFIFTVN